MKNLNVPAARKTSAPKISLEQRLSRRAKLRSRLFLRVESPVTGRQEFGAAQLMDISLLGASVCANLSLRKGQWVDVTIITEDFARSMGLPSHLHGRAVVRRVVKMHHGENAIIALAFAPSLSQNLDFATYMACLRET